ncbi:SDR family oxidoreductase [Pseudoalteromonas sp. H105]|uniref:SDR family oxidoreductase n=1 Tax=Pseudoalteromonas sp. H105 TaxID=1348393 RepID=UPI00073202E0|nr:SDR family oxidoreductase [Pseudoalteromonas sp. H105]KTF16626.1 oxidoreductase [Pseudoalteromonas sp. H105]
MKRRVCILTGATGGIGQAIAKTLSEQGWHLLLVGRDAQLLATLSTQCTRCDVFAGDLTKRETQLALLEKAQQIGGASLLINNAGINSMQSIESMKEQQIEAILDTNLTVPIKLCQLFLNQLRESEGTIVNVGSSFGSIGYPYQTAYCASKFGLRGFTEALSRELTDSKVSVTYLAPRATDTAINNCQIRALNEKLGNKMDPPEVVAKDLVALINSKKTQRFIGYPEKIFARINALFPHLVDKAIAKQLPIIKRFIH